MKRRLLNAFSKVKRVPGAKRLMQPLVRRKVNKTIDEIAHRFFEHFRLVVALDEEQQEVCFRARHEVYCEELGYEDERRNKLEFDEFDEYALNCYIEHKNTGECAGTIRLVMPHHPGQELPMEQNCPDAIRAEENSPKRLPRQSVCEVSRLAIPSRFRRREADRKVSPITGKALDDRIGNTSKRDFPFLSLALYFFAASICLLRDIEKAYVMMEPRLARSMRMMGIHFVQVGPVVDYHGKRAAYQVNPVDLIEQVSPALKKFQRQIMGELEDVPEFGDVLRKHTYSYKRKSEKRRKAA